jgi:hypothetical protein
MYKYKDWVEKKKNMIVRIGSDIEKEKLKQTTITT